MKRNKTQEPVEMPAGQVIDFPVLPTEVGLGRLDTPGGAYAVITLGTILTSATFILDRGQLVTLGSEMLKLAEKLPREAKESKLVVPPGLVVPE